MHVIHWLLWLWQCHGYIGFDAVLEKFNIRIGVLILMWLRFRWGLKVKLKLEMYIAWPMVKALGFSDV